MIKFIRVTYRNFLSNGDQPTTIELDKTITSIFTGTNGAGKSTFIDAIVYALFGKPFRKVKLGQLINNVNEKGLECEVEFTVGSKHYRVNRGMKPSLFEIYVNNELIPQPATTADYQSILESDILKLNYKTFTQIIILGSASFVPFMQLKLGDRREVIENLLDISVFSDMNAILKDKIKTVKKEQEDISHKIDIIKERYRSKRQFIKEATEQHKTRLDELEIKVKDISDILENKKYRLVLYQSKSIKLETTIDEYGDAEERVAALARHIEALGRVVFEDTNAYETFKSDAGGAVLIDKRIDENNKLLVTEEKKIKDLNKLLLDQEEIYKDFLPMEDRDQIKTDLAITTNTRCADVLRLEFYEKNDECPECKQGIETHFREDIIHDLEHSIAKADENLAIWLTREKVIEQDIKDKKQVHSTVMNIQSSIVYVQNEIKRLKESNEGLIATREQRVIKTPEELKYLFVDITKKKEEIETERKSGKTLKKQNEELTTHKNSLIVIEKDIAVCDQSIEANKIRFDTLQEELRIHKEKPACTVTQEDIDELAMEIKELDSSLGKKKNSLHYFGIVQKLLKDDGLKTKIIKKFLPIINATVNMYLDKFDFPINFEFDENFNETIQSNFRNDFCYYSFSEGEKSRIDLALLFTWREIALKKSRNATNIIIFDEIFDGSLDGDGIENFMNILGFDKEGYNSFIISHKDETINSRFDRQVEFIKDGHFSKMMEK